MYYFFMLFLVACIKSTSTNKINLRSIQKLDTEINERVIKHNSEIIDFLWKLLDDYSGLESIYEKQHILELSKKILKEDTFFSWQKDNFIDHEKKYKHKSMKTLNRFYNLKYDTILDALGLMLFKKELECDTKNQKNIIKEKSLKARKFFNKRMHELSEELKEMMNYSE